MSLADELQEQKNAGKLKIEDVYDFLVPCMEIFPRFYVQSTHITL